MRYCTIAILASMGFLTPSSAETNPEAKQLIKLFDKNDDQKLDQQELAAALKSLEQKPAAFKAAEAPPETFEFIRVKRNKKKKPITLETSTARYESKDGKLQVDLIGAVHVGDKRYYTDLNQQFTKYDVVLYELVAPEGTRIPKGGRKSEHPLGKMQEFIKDTLDLSFQLNHVDYEKKNLVHADMTPEEFSKSMKDRGESFIQILFKMWGQGLSQSAKGKGPSDADLLMALFSSKRSLKLKQIFASQFEDLESAMAVFEGPDGSTLISERNKKALSVLRKEMAAGKKKIGIFYGSGHMRDLSARLKTEFNLVPKTESWSVAWDMSR